MERRNFVKGLLLSATAGTALVKLANPKEIHALTVQKDVTLSQAKEVAVDQTQALIDELPYRDVFIKRGKDFIPIGKITHIEQRHSMISCDYSGEAVFIPGVRDVRFFFAGPGENYET